MTSFRFRSRGHLVRALVSLGALAMVVAAVAMPATPAQAGKWQNCKSKSSGQKFQVTKISCEDGAAAVADPMWKSWNGKKSNVQWSNDCMPWVPGNVCKLKIGKKWDCVGVHNPLRSNLVGWWNWKCEKKKGKAAVKGKYPQYDWLLSEDAPLQGRNGH